MKKLITAILALAVFLGLAAGAEAATATTTISISATAIPVCTVSTTAVNFGSITGLTYVLANGDISVNCPSGTPYNIALDAGLYYNSVSGWRQINNGANTRSYGLWKIIPGTAWGDSDYANTYPWGSSVADTGSGVAQAHTVYGGLVSGSALPAGAYSDTVTVTVYY